MWSAIQIVNILLLIVFGGLAVIANSFNSIVYANELQEFLLWGILTLIPLALIVATLAIHRGKRSMFVTVPTLVAVLFVAWSFWNLYFS